MHLLMEKIILINDHKKEKEQKNERLLTACYAPVIHMDQLMETSLMDKTLQLMDKTVITAHPTLC